MLPPLLHRARAIVVSISLVTGLLLGGVSPFGAALAAPTAADSSPSLVPPANVEILAPTSDTVRSSTTGGLNTLTVEYKYETPSAGSDPDIVGIQLVSPPDTAFYQFDDSGYAGDGSRTSRSLDLTAPNDGTSGAGLTDGRTYDLRLLAVDTNGDTTATTTTGGLTIDNTAPSSVTVDGPTTATVKRTDQTLDVQYSYQEAHPDSATIVFDDGAGNTATFGIDDSGYAGNNNSKTATLSLSNTTATGGSGLTDGTTYDLTVTAIDSAGNSDSALASDRLTIDETAPSVTAITRPLPTPTNADSVAFEVSFSETVTGLDGSDFTLSSAPDGGASITGVSTSGDTTVAVESMSGDGTLALGVVDGDDDVTDAAGNVLDDATAPSTDEAYTVDNTPPAISGDVTAPDSSYEQGEGVSFTVPYDETVDVSGGPPVLELDVDGETREAAFDSGAGTNSLTFTYTVQPGDSTLAFSASTLQLNGGAITDAAGNNAALDFSGQTDLSGTSIDGTAPPIANRVLSNDGSNNLTFQFETNEPLDTIDVTVDGPTTADLYSFDESDFTKKTGLSGEFDIRYTLDQQQPYGDGGGTYAATIDAAVDTVGNDGAAATSVNYELPTARDTSITIDEDTQFSEAAPGVLSNDTPAGVSVERVEGSAADVGTPFTLDSDADLTLNADGSLTYTPAGAFEEFTPTDDTTDTFTYTLLGPAGGTSPTPATVRVTINGVNDAPTIVNNDVLGLSSGNKKTITSSSLKAEDLDDAASALTFTLQDEPVNGTLLKNGSSLGQGDTFSQQDIIDGLLEYEHGGSGDTDNFNFTVSDGRTQIAETEFGISIGTNASPTADNDNATTSEDDVLAATDPAAGVLSNDTDPDGDDLVVSEVNGTPNAEDSVPVQGNSVIAIDSSGTYTFNPSDEFHRLDAGDTATPVVGYTAADGNGGTDQANLNLTVQGKNDLPRIATNSGLDGVRIGARESILSLNLRAADVDGDDGASTLTFNVQTPPGNGTLLKSGSPLNTNDTFTQADLNDGKVAYQHDGSQTSSDSFTFTLTDDSGDGPSEATFSISISAGIPTARNDTFIVAEDSSLAVPSAGTGVLANDSDPTQDDLTASIVALTGPGNGTLGNLPNISAGGFTYTPDDGFSGRDSFDYSAADPAENADTAAVQIAVLPAAEQYVTTQGQALSIPVPDTAVLGPDAGQAVDTLGEVSVSSAPSAGSVTFNDDTFEYTPDNGFSGTDTFEYEVGSGLGETVSARISVQVRPAQQPVNVSRSFPNPTDQQSFRLVALPGSPGASLASTLPGTRGEDWRGFREGGATDTTAFSRKPCGTEAPCSLTAGTGYWLIARSDWSVDDNIGTVSLQPDDGGSVPSVVRIPLQDGWNIISNPLGEDVSWAAVQSASGTDQALFRWRDGWLEAQTFASAASGEAYYFRDDNIDTLVVPFPGVQRKAPSAPTEETKTKRAAEGRALALHVVQNGDTLSTVRAGRRSDSKRGFDTTDRYGPPGYFGASLRLLPPGPKRPPALRTEYKPPNGDGSAFDLRLRTSADSALTLTTDGADAFADDEVALVNRSSGRSHDLKATPAVTVAPSSSTTRFKLLVGSAAFVNKAQQKAVPDEVTLRPNYPNPFRRTTTIEYSLPSAQDVQLVVYDVLGRRVETIVDSRQQAGFHTLQWDGGRSLASGMYFARLVAGSTTKTERLVILR